MPTQNPNLSPGQRYTVFGEAIRQHLPHLASVLNDEDNFIALRISVRPDRSVLAVLKRYGHDGGPMVCFGGGYGVVGAFMAINAAVQGDAWRPDKPWSPNGEHTGK